ncbi:hypothetical protein [Pseudonocardia sp. 73-21]|uniref:hypothetical protein n=1 Tax=Pseudonocardia sp. 73-21 TaxID=1895809 RepID=UPI0009662BA2|nr:hypothetical protein [Pseudonocardia sp. 73-21]OJY39814.1 MAG: hypothetical protein BGP03_21230 [Pseudonocardia sp. 73-21]
MNASDVMWTISRIRLDRIGPTAARFLDVTLDLRDDGGLPLDTIIWLRNGGGKSTVLSLVCALIRPYRRDFLATAATGKHLEDYVLGADTAHVIVEWSGPQGRRLVTGAVYEWADRTQPADPNRDHDRLNARWYVFSPAEGRAELDLLPFGEVQKDFVAAVRDLDAIPGCGAAVTDRADRWRRLLDEHGLDTEIFTPILQMNATEGGIEGQFQFRGADQFVQYLLELIVDPEVPGQVAEILESVRAGLADRPELLADLTFADEAVPRLRALAVARDERTAAADAVARQEAAARELAGALAAAAADADLEHRTGAERARRHTDEAASHARAAEAAHATATALRHHAAALRLATAEADVARLAEQERAAGEQVAAWRATPAVHALREAEQRAAALAGQLAAATEEAEPLRERRDRAAAGYAAALRRSIAAVDDQVADLRAGAEADAEQERAARVRGEEARDERARLTAALSAAQDALASLDRDLAAAVAAGHLETGETVPAAVERHTAADAAAATTSEEADAGRRALVEERRGLQERASALAAARAAAEQEHDAAAQRRRELQGRADDLARDERLRSLGGGEALDPVVEAGDLGDALATAIARTERRRVELAVDGAEDERALAALAATGLLPGGLDLVRARDALERAGIAAATGWGYLAETVPAVRHAAVLQAAPALASGLLVHDERDLPAAREAVLAAGLRPTSAVVIGTTADLAAVSSGAVSGTHPFVVPPAPALIDRAAAGAELTARERARADRAGADDALAAELARDTDLRRRLRRLREDCSPGTLDALVAEEAAATARLTDLAVQARLVEEAADALGERERALDDARTAAERTRRAAAAALGTLAGLAPREEDAAGLRRRVATLPAEIADCARTVTAESDAEADHRRLAATALDHAGSLARTAAAQRADLAALGDVGTADGPETSVNDARATFDSARAAYDREVSGSALASSLAEARRALERARDQVGELPATVRAVARDLLDTADGHDASARTAATARADAAHAHARTSLADATAESRLARSEVDRHPAVDDVVTGSHTPPVQPDLSATREGALAAASAADAEAQEHRRRREESAAAAAAVVAAQAGARDRATAMRHLGELLAAKPEPDREPFTGPAEDARAAVDRAREALDAATAAAARSRRAVDKLGQETALWAAEDRFAGVKPPVRDRFRASDAAEDLLAGAERLADDLDLLAVNLRGRLDELEEHKGVVVTAMVGMVRQALKSLQRAQALSELPESLGEWAGQRFLDVGPRASVETADAVLRERCSRLVDTLTARGVPVPRGHELLWQATSAVVGEGNWKAKVLKPSTTFALERVSVERMRKWSGGEKVTISLLLFCMVAKLRATGRGRDQPGLGALPLDNPLGKANYVVFLNLQRKVAAANGIQLIFLTGVGDMKAVGRFPNVIRMRNTRTRSREYVSIAEREVAGTDPAGVVDTTRIWREDPTLTLL